MTITGSCLRDGVAWTWDQSRQWHEPLGGFDAGEYSTWLESQLLRLEERFVEFQTAQSVTASLKIDRAGRS